MIEVIGHAPPSDQREERICLLVYQERPNRDRFAGLQPLRRETSIDIQHCAGDERRSIRGEKQRRCRNVHRRANAAQWVELEHGFAVGFSAGKRLLEQRRSDVAGTEFVLDVPSKHIIVTSYNDPKSLILLMWNKL